MELVILIIGHLDLSTIYEELVTVRNKWWVIGLELQVPFHKLKEFEQESEPFAAIIDYWLKGNVEDVPVTWRSVVAVLESTSVDEKGLAWTIINKYCQPETDSNKG